MADIPKVWMAGEWSPEIMAPLKEKAEIVSGAEELRPGLDAVIIGKADSAFMDRMGPNLKHIAFPGIGVDAIDIPAASKRGILVTNNPNAPTESTAEHAVALLMALAKRVVLGDLQLRGVKIPRKAFCGTEMLGRTLGVLGYGRIGRRVAEICSLGLKMNVVVYDPIVDIETPTPDGVTLVSNLDAVITEADFLTLHTPLLPETRGLMNESRIRSMKPGSYLINASRGPVVDEAALVRALKDGHLAGAGLDVFDPEPPQPDNPLFKMINVVVTPHIASSTDRGFFRMCTGTVDQILMVLRGEKPPFLVDPEAWPGRAHAPA